jgi:hypothetical protein
MIEIHHVRRKAASAIAAGNVSQLPDERDLLLHPLPRPSEKLIPMRDVVATAVFPSIAIATPVNMTHYAS